MKRFTRFAGLALALAMLLALGGCGNKAETPQEVVEKAQAALETVTGFRADMAMDMNISASGTTIESTTVSNIVSCTEPASMYMTLEMSMGDFGGTTMEYYTVGNDKGGYTMYISQDGGNLWYSQELAGLDELGQYEADATMATYLGGSENFTEDVTETINGVEATRYNATISRDSFEEILSAAGVDSMLSQFGISEEDAAAVYSELAAMPLSVWIAKDSYYPVRYEMDMTELMQSLMSNMFSAVYGEGVIEIEVGRVFISMDMYDFNEVEPITVPQEIIDSAIAA